MASKSASGGAFCFDLNNCWGKTFGKFSHILQVYSPEVLRAFGQALINLLKNLAMYLRAMEALRAQHDTSEWLPRLIFLLLQNPLNGKCPVLTSLFAIAQERPAQPL